LGKKKAHFSKNHAGHDNIGRDRFRDQYNFNISDDRELHDLRYILDLKNSLLEDQKKTINCLLRAFKTNS
jgi:hypothetical protein